ncbi:GNAT family N-acetyltransferase [Ramlibacter sp. WS9]|uniref:GNAT family N-acetyltransferase n=1 Tax=Ramlibacter sp. WS9 TaxID=1882741 RepID=UPI001144ECFA|nr:GNAT family N-acetyltransferase [Ramlibacter sp. WS9]ROZ76601.1 N-acetyltransferase [Ramlibacter sp. WS9]
MVPELRGDRVHLRELTEADVPAWFARATDAESAALAGDPIPESIEAGFVWLARNRERFRQQTGIRWSIVPNGSAESVGSIGLAITSKDERIAELGVVIGRAWWGKGLGTAAAQLVARYAVDALNLAEIRAELLQSNMASRRLLEKAGFRFEAVIPDFDQSDAGSVDGLLYVLRGPDGTETP